MIMNLKKGDYDISDVDRELASIISTLDRGAVYKRLILHTLSSKRLY